jgi:hypothetical protein
LWPFTATAWRCANSGGKRPGCCIMTVHRLTLPVSPWNFCPKAIRMPFPTHSTFFSCLPDWK